MVVARQPAAHPADSVIIPAAAAVGRHVRGQYGGTVGSAVAPAVGALLVSFCTSSLKPTASEVLDVGDLDADVVELRVGYLDDFLPHKDVPVLVA